MKAILISIKPKWVAKILNGEKTIEIRKTMPKCDLPIDAYIYCTKDNSDGYLYYSFGKTIFHDKYVLIKEYDKQCIIGNGRVVAKFTLNKVEEVMMTYSKGGIRYDNGFGLKEEDDDIYYTLSLKPNDLCNKSCLSEDELVDYLDMEDGYAWFISNLVIFDRPRELGEFNKYGCRQYDNDVCETYGERGHLYTNCFFHLTKAPQSWQFIEAED